MDKNKISSIVFYFSILAFIIAFNFEHNPPSGWYQQFLPNTGGRQISDVFFLDSLTGWAVTAFTQQNDTVYVTKTTNGGDNWFVHYTGTGQFVGMQKIYFLNELVGYACGNGFDNSNQNNFAKTTNGGSNWFQINPPDQFEVYHDLSVLNEDTIWLAASSNPTGGVFRTTNGGINWTRQLNLGSDNPDKIYMFNSRIGFISSNKGTRYIRKTTNSGNNWTLIVSNDYYNDVYFTDSLTGWKCSVFGMKKTTDGGINWTVQQIPSGGIIINSAMLTFSNINRDTIWGVGGVVLYPNNQIRSILYRTTNEGDSWFYQVPDTSLNIGQYYFINFVNKLNGWANPQNNNKLIHTTTGGDTTFYTSITPTGSIIPSNFKLYQNYPNPFNPKTKISYELLATGYISLRVYNIQGKEIKNFINKKQNSGGYQIEFDGTGLTSGVYFYSLLINGERVDTKKMVLVR